jgi:hypothetical protein
MEISQTVHMLKKDTIEVVRVDGDRISIRMFSSGDMGYSGFIMSLEQGADLLKKLRSVYDVQ